MPAEFQPGAIMRLLESHGAYIDKLSDPAFSARIAAQLTGLPVVVVCEDVDASGVYHRNRLIEVSGRRDDIMLIYAIWHEVGHHFDPWAGTTAPIIEQEFAANLYACDFFLMFLPQHHDYVQEQARALMRRICDHWHLADLIVHPVGDDVAAWCGWKPVPPRLHDPVWDC